MLFSGLQKHARVLNNVILLAKHGGAKTQGDPINPCDIVSMDIRDQLKVREFKTNTHFQSGQNLPILLIHFVF